MPRRHHVAIVAQNPTFARALLSWLSSAGYELAVATTFAAGRALLSSNPALIICEVKLGEYNGLHLALKASSAGVPAIVIGPRDTVLERDAKEMGVPYISSILRRSDLLALVGERLTPTDVPVLADLGSNGGDWPRKSWQSDPLRAQGPERTTLH